MRGVFTIDLTGVTPSINLDGTDMTNVASVDVSQAHGEFPRVAVLFDAHSVVVKGTGNVELQSKGPTPSQFLASIDVDAVATDALSNVTYGTSPMALFVQRLKELADGS